MDTVIQGKEDVGGHCPYVLIPIDGMRSRVHSPMSVLISSPMRGPQGSDE